MNNILAKSLGSGIAVKEEQDDDDDEESADIEDDSVEEDKTEDEDKSPNEKIKTIIQSAVDYSLQHVKRCWLRLSRYCPRIGGTCGYLLTQGIL